MNKPPLDPSDSNSRSRLDRIVADTRRKADQRSLGYREQALKMYPWICGRCMREFTRANLQELTVHHRNHDHDYNPADGSNWELLCVYCHDNEHSRQLDARSGSDGGRSENAVATGNPFADLKAQMARKKI
jgi:5-methylcytosine-specific restriction endonuclease McrA